MRKPVQQRYVAVFLLAIGLVSFLYGVHRGEHLTVEKKSCMICLECIGIG